MAFVDVVGGDIGVEMMDVVVLDAVGESTEDLRHLEISAAFQCCLCEIPLLLPLTVRQIHRMLQVKQSISQSLCKMERYVHSPSRQTQPIEHPHKYHSTQQLFSHRCAENSIFFDAVVEYAEEPQDLYRDKEEYDWFPKNSDDDFGRHFHFRVLFFCEKDGLGEISAVQIAKMFVMVVVALPPHVKWEVHIHSDHLPHRPIQADGGKEGKVSHIMELYEHPYHIQDIQRPPQQSQVVMEQSPHGQLVNHSHSDSLPGLAVVGLDVATDVSGYFLILRCSLRHFIYLFQQTYQYELPSADSCKPKATPQMQLQPAQNNRIQGLELKGSDLVLIVQSYILSNQISDQRRIQLFQISIPSLIKQITDKHAQQWLEMLLD